MMKRTLLALGALLLVGAVNTRGQEILAQWNFNGADAAAQAVPSAGAGTLAPIGGITVSAPTSGSGSSDPVTTGDNAYQTTGYPAQGTGDQTAGIEVAVSTAGYKNIVFKFDYRGSNTSSRKLAVLYSLDGTTFIEGIAPIITAGGAFTNELALDLSTITGANDNPLFKVRVVTAFDGETYAAISGTYGTAGTARFDMVTVAGDSLGGQPLPPVIFTQPANRTNVVGSAATFSVVASGTAPLTFIWEKDKQDGLGTWEPVNGGNTATLTLPNVQLADSGTTYRVRVTNAVDSVVSTTATLTVIEDPATTPRTIASLKTEVDLLTNTNGVDTAGLFLVEGIVTTHANLTTGAVNWLFYMQDGTGGVAVFWRNRNFEPKVGDRILVKAPLAHFNGLLELTPNSNTAGHAVTLVNSGNPVPASTAFDYNWLADFAAIEAQEGKLAVTANVTINPGADLTFRGNTTYPLTGPVGESFTLFVNNGTDLVGQPIPGGPATITGVLGQFDSLNPRDSSYQIIPSRYADIESTTKAPSIRFTNSLANLVRPGDLPVNTFRDHALRPGESITIAFEISDPEGKPVTVTLGNTIPAGALWNFANLTGTTVTGTFTYTATAAAAGNAYPITVQAANDTTSFTQTINLYVPTVAEQAVVITEFYANPTETATAPNFNPLNRAELLPGGNDASPANRDEFVEIVNLSGETIDLTGWMLSDALLRRAYLYAGTPGTTLAPSNSVIIYGGPTLGYTPQLSVPAIAAEVGPGDAFSTAGIALNNDGDTIVLRNAASNVVSRVVYVGAQTSADSSLTRFPTSQDAFVAHRTAADAYWSPGNQAGGLAWTEPQPNADVAPTFTTPPTDVSVVVGTPATFTVVAAGLPAPTYQWQRGESNIETATAASYTLASPQLTDSGATFRVIVANRAGSITSAPVTLTVTEPPPEILKTNIAYLRTQVDPVNLRPANTTQLYEVEGSVTTHVNLTGSANTFFYLQDETAAISVFVTGKPGSEVPPAGARVRVVGPLGHFNGLLELNLAASNAKHVVEVLSTGNALPATTALDYAWPTTVDGVTATSPGVAAAEANEAKLVRVNNVLVDTATGPNFASGSNVVITNAADPGKTFVLRIDSRVTEIIGTPKPTGPVSLVGVLGQFDNADPRAGGYQLIVTRLADIITGGTPEPITTTAAVTAESVTLSWNGTAGATYSVRRGLAPQGPFESIATGLTLPTFTEATGGRDGAFYQITSP